MVLSDFSPISSLNLKGCNPKLRDRLGRSAFTELKEDDENLRELLEWGVSLRNSVTEGKTDILNRR